MLFHESNIIKIIKLGVYAVLFLPLIVVPLLFFPFSTSKAFLFQAIVEIIFALYFIVALKNPEYRPKKTLLFYAVSFYFIALLLSAVFGLDFYHSFFGNYERMWGFFQLLHFFLFFSIQNIMSSEDVIFIFFCLYSLSSRFFLPPRAARWSASERWQSRPLFSPCFSFAESP